MTSRIRNSNGRDRATEPMRCGWCITGHHARCRQPCPCDHPSHREDD